LVIFVFIQSGQLIQVANLYMWPTYTCGQHTSCQLIKTANLYIGQLIRVANIQVVNL